RGRGRGFGTRRRASLHPLLRRRSLPFFRFRGCGFFRRPFWFFGCLRFFFFRCFRFFLRRLFLFFWRGFTLLADEGDPLADFNFAAFFHVNFGERPVLGRFPFHRRLVGFDFGDDVAGGNLVALLLFPRHERSLGHRVVHFGPLDV